MTGRAFVIGAGLAGLAAAVDLVKAGRAVTVFEASPHAGGRCRSFEDTQLGQVIDNGNHLVLSGNTSVARYCEEIGADGWHTADQARFPFMDIASGARWAIDINDGRFPAWIFSPRRRAPGTGMRDYLPALRMLFAPGDGTVEALLDTASPAYKLFWEPLVLAVLNTPLDQAAARLLQPVFQETILKGGAQCRPMIARHSLDEALIGPALRYLKAAGGDVHFSARVEALTVDRGVVASVRAGGHEIALEPADDVVLALPSWQTVKLLPQLELPGAGEGILNIHYRVETGVTEPAFLGLVSSLAQWVFVRPDAASVTVSAAGRAMAQQPERLAKQCWSDVAAAYGWNREAVPPYRVIKEKRATFDQTPQALASRKIAQSQWRNLILAGDWTDTGLPATIEGAVRSGQTAAAVIARKS
ncbi:MAG: hydroxysqualene dehydroxylase HpnE [Pseudomonadota bacterium]